MRGGEVQTQEASRLTSRSAAGRSRGTDAVRDHSVPTALGRSYGRKNSRKSGQQRIVNRMSLAVRSVTVLENKLFPTDTS